MWRKNREPGTIITEIPIIVYGLLSFFLISCGVYPKSPDRSLPPLYVMQNKKEQLACAVSSLLWALA